MSRIKTIIRSNFWGSYFISSFHCIKCKVMPRMLNDEKAIKRYYKKSFGKKIDLNNPRTFAEKINWYKLNDKKPLMEKCADKVSVRDYVIEKGYENCLNEVYGVYNRVEDIDLDKLPNQFVIKATHGSHMCYIVNDKESFDWKHAKIMMKTWLKQDIYWSGREWVYKNLPRRIIVEKYLKDETGGLRDYKFFCYHGKPYYLQIDIGRFDSHYRNYYDMDMKLLELSDNENLPNLTSLVTPLDPKLFDHMKKMCSDLSSPFQQVRVDLYLVGDTIYFGELTFFDGGGSSEFFPEEWNYKFSEEWVIN